MSRALTVVIRDCNACFAHANEIYQIFHQLLLCSTTPKYAKNVAVFAFSVYAISNVNLLVDSETSDSFVSIPFINLW